ncbi:hypothetical protein VTH06DRAFT_1833 [Thermothelomyces fergusii]
MKFALLPAFFAAAQATDYFFRYLGGNEIIDHQRLRGNNSIQHFSPGVTLPPYNPQDHFLRIYPNTTEAPTAPPALELLRVPTQPHPPPVPGYYGLSDAERVPDAYRLVYSYRPDDEGPGFAYRGWRLRPAPPAGGDPAVLRPEYPAIDGGAAARGRRRWRWIAVREREGEFDRWVPWYVRPSAANRAVLATWDYVNVVLELVEAKGPVDSTAPGGVLE